jgi:hypothetical protein
MRQNRLQQGAVVPVVKEPRMHNESGVRLTSPTAIGKARAVALLDAKSVKLYETNRNTLLTFMRAVFSLAIDERRPDERPLEERLQLTGRLRYR